MLAHLLLMPCLLLVPTFTMETVEIMEQLESCLSSQQKCLNKAQCCSGLDCLPTRGFSFACQEDVYDGDQGEDDDQGDDGNHGEMDEGPDEQCQGVWEECLGDRECCNDLKCVDFTCL